ncbi:MULTISPECIES: SAM-dependent methyltransferase [unclassified Streptomyces]|uniref:SAM-dependent methyltransferase n=1 Tax=unclassified Streptomyces TaxID=2593676 RepID=UPI002E12315D|nr:MULTISPECIES: SAM-dependent methyltransferase [unclassified Streptomyces]WSJ35899.1 SAM-dependent methyltransferase [Streptomyces sp. NBC_01321]WSP57827.1 SAM-dependent methyltransferase [Streptomyces sp. NBC_01241]WSP62348.1 SAM-dependent methyltransferase [Streptomyces sp. NBC_01240]WSU21436.1 SAM-dependent methyltransferase [Streptomyces sp. NBC_01108]
MTEATAPLDDRIRSGIAHNARVWNHWLGGTDNYPVDRAVGDRVTAMYPSIGEVARADRAFLGRAVRYLAGDAGIGQFLDIGSGLPTADNTHEVAQHTAPDSRVVYVDNDPIVLTHARALLTSSPEGATRYIDADARHPEQILRAVEPTLDPTKPVAVMLLGILNFVLDTDEAQAIIRTLMDAMPSGSHLVLTHPTLELGGEGNEAAMRFWNENATPPITARSRAEFAAFLTGLDLVDPGIVSCARWRTDPGTTAPVVAQFGAVARKP